MMRNQKIFFHFMLFLTYTHYTSLIAVEKHFQLHYKPVIVESQLYKHVDRIENPYCYADIITRLTKLTIFCLERIKYDTLQISVESFKQHPYMEEFGGQKNALMWFISDVYLLNSSFSVPLFDQCLVNMVEFFSCDLSNKHILSIIEKYNGIARNNIKCKKELLYGLIRAIGDTLDIIQYHGGVFPKIRSSIQEFYDLELEVENQCKPLNLYKTLVYKRISYP